MGLVMACATTSPQPQAATTAGPRARSTPLVDASQSPQGAPGTSIAASADGPTTQHRSTRQARVEPQPEAARAPKPAQASVELTPLLSACTGPANTFSIRRTEVRGDTLDIQLQHGGGCEEHTYQACWNGSFAMSQPPRAAIEIRHNGHEDRCKALISKSLSIDLARIRTALPQGEITLDVAGERVGYPAQTLTP